MHDLALEAVRWSRAKRCTGRELGMQRYFGLLLLLLLLVFLCCQNGIEPSVLHSIGIGNTSIDNLLNFADLSSMAQL